jgi:hypothetical protein
MTLAALPSAVSLTDTAELKIGEMSLATLSLAMLASLASALVLSWAYSFCFGPRATGSQVHRAFPLISIAVTAIFICVQFSLPLSLGLLGSLSVVRFRTPIKEPEEIGFIMLVIAAALCCAAYRMGFLLLLLGSTLVVVLLLRWSPRFLGRRAGTGTLVVRLNEGLAKESSSALTQLVEQHLGRLHFDSLSSHATETVITWSFCSVSLSSASALEQALQAQLPGAAVGIYYHGYANE